MNVFQASFKLKEKRREGAKVIKRYHPPATPYQRALTHPKVGKAIKQRLRVLYRTLDPVALLAEIRAAQNLLGARLDRRAGKGSHDAAGQTAASAAPEIPAFAKALGKTTETGEPRATHRRPKRRYRTRMRMSRCLTRTSAQSRIGLQPSRN